jgi:hypothetical protein
MYKWRSFRASAWAVRLGVHSANTLMPYVKANESLGDDDIFALNV